ncbi:MAG: YlbF family regulator [Lachnospiraceae bacterium]|jgi:cell fate (sporulation/competence/biofilm development) regulator YlbF (YheA/YmcA/DUF963 family)|nr:YlbF family regulator [Lachnospiraceae bacterium]
MLEKAITDITSELIEKVKASSTYNEYVKHLYRIKGEQELYGKVNEYRRKNYILQTEEPAEGLMEKIDRLEEEYEPIIDNPLVRDFLRAELAFCRMMQEINRMIAREVDFQ